MSTLRHHVLHHRPWAAWLIALTLFMKVVVPGGYMLVSSHGSISLQICSGFAPMNMPMPGGDHGSDKQDHGKPEQPCTFAGLNAPVTGGADPLLVALLVAFIVATVFRTIVPPAPRQHPRLRPPLRAPPAHL